MDTATDFRKLADGEVYFGGGWKRASNLFADKENTICALTLHDADGGEQPVILVWKGITVQGAVNRAGFTVGGAALGCSAGSFLPIIGNLLGTAFGAAIGFALDYYSTAPDGYTNVLTKARIHDQLIKADNAAHYRHCAEDGTKVVPPGPRGNDPLPRNENGKGNEAPRNGEPASLGQPALASSETTPAATAMLSGDNRISPELRQWALRQVKEEEVVAGLRELRKHGGLELHDFVQELEQMAQERPK